MIDCFFVACGSRSLPDALGTLQLQIKKDIQAYRQKLIDVGNRVEIVDMLYTFKVESYTVLPEMVPVQPGLLTPGTQQQFTTQYTVVVLIVVNKELPK